MNRWSEIGASDFGCFDHCYHPRMIIPALASSLPATVPRGYPLPVPVKEGRPWESFKVIPIRMYGTNKTTKQDNTAKAYGRKQVKEGNTLDTVRGCPGGATNGGRGCPWGCSPSKTGHQTQRSACTATTVSLISLYP